MAVRGSQLPSRHRALTDLRRESELLATRTDRRRLVARCLICLATASSGYPAWAQDGGDHLVPLFPSADDEVRQGFVRVINHSGRGGEVRIEAVDDEGVQFGPVTLAMDASETVHFNSTDLEEGNPEKGLSGGVGTGTGDWRLTLSSGLDVEVLSYIRTPADGFLTSMHDLVAPGEDGAHRVAIFNPGSNRDQVSRLRLINPVDEDAEVTITGTDGSGASPGDSVRLTLPAGTSRMIDAHELESGGTEFTGALGNGAGKWQLMIEADRTIHAMSLLLSPTGHLTNLSTAPANADEGVHTVPMFPAASDPLGRQGFVRVINHSAEPVAVTISAFDDTDRNFGTSQLALEANETVHFNSDDLEMGNATKGLTGGTGAGEGDWRLELKGAPDMEVLAYIRTKADGFLTAMHDTVPREGRRNRVAIFNPASNVNQESRLRLVNAGDEEVEVKITGIDGARRTSGGSATVAVPAGASSTLTAQELEAGGDGFDGELGAGTGKWQLLVESEQPITVLSLLSSPTGHLTNLSTAPSLDYAPSEGTVFDDRAVGKRIATDDEDHHSDFLTGGRFRETIGPDVYEGDYGYSRTGPNEGTLVSDYDDGDRCTARLVFRSRTAGTSAYTCEGGESGELAWWIVDIPGVGGAAARTVYEVEDTIETMPTGSWFPDRTRNGSFVVSGGTVTITLDHGGFVEAGDYRYTCESDGGCSIEDRVVMSGRIVETAISDAAGKPDLVVESPSASATAPIAGSSLTVSATARNRGGGNASAVTLRFYRSSNPTVSTGDAEVGAVELRGLTASGASEQSIEITVPDESGTYYFGACADIVDGESDKRNNCSGSARVEVRSGQATVSIPDANLRAALESALGKASGARITEAELATLTTLTAQAKSIERLTGLEAAVNLTELYLGWNNVSDASPLAGLAHLKKLSLRSNAVPDLSRLGGLTDLVLLNLENNAISDLSPVSGMSELAEFYAGWNDISDPSPLADLTRLERLDLQSNHTSNLSFLTGLTNLSLLSLGFNEITDVSPLSGLTNLRELWLYGNRVSDVSPFSDLTNLGTLVLWQNAISDISPLANLVNLTWLGLGSNPVTDLSPLAGLTKLTMLALNGIEITDLSTLEPWLPLRTGLVELNLFATGISDISLLEGLVNLEWLHLGKNSISDLSPLSTMTNLGELWLMENEVASLDALADLNRLRRLRLGINDIADVSPLGGLSHLSDLDLQFNRITDIAALTRLNELSRLDLRGNALSDSSIGDHIPVLESRGASVFYDSFTVGDYNIELVLPDEFTGRHKNILDYVARRWMAVISEDLPDYEFTEGWSGTCGDQAHEIAAGERIDDLRIHIGTFEGGNAVGYGGPSLLREESHLPVVGCMAFDLTNANLLITGLHEIGHVLGFGPIWEELGFLQDKEGDTHFNGARAVAAFDEAGGANYAGAKVPVQRHEGHWRSSVFPDELMRPGGGSTLSAITVESLADLGYGVDATQADAYSLPAATVQSSSLRAFGGVAVLEDDHSGHLIQSSQIKGEMLCDPRTAREPLQVVDQQGRAVRRLGE